MIDYASTAREILDAQPRAPDWVKERIRESDELRDQLEEINLREAEEREPIERHNRRYPDRLRPIPKRQVSALLRLPVGHLAAAVELSGPVPHYPVKLLDLVFEIQEALFEMGGYRVLAVPEEEEAL